MSFKIPPSFKKDKNAGLILEDGEEDVEMFLIRHPKQFDVTKLDGVKFSPNEIMDVEVQNSTASNLVTRYELSPFCMSCLDLAPIIQTDNKCVLGPQLTGLLTITQSYNFEQSNSSGGPGLPTQGPVPMPEGLKSRFVPFGAGTPVKNPMFTMKRTKKKRKRHHKDSEIETHNVSSAQPGMSEHVEDVYQANGVNSSKRQSDSGLHDTSLDTSHYLDIADIKLESQEGDWQDGSVKKKHKKKKKIKQEEDTAPFTESAISSPNKYSSKKEKKKMIKSEKDTASLSTLPNENSPRKKKIKHNPDVTDNIVIDRTGNRDTDSALSKKKKHSRFSLQNGSV